MASIEDFENHCWQGVVPAEEIALYSVFARETHVGPRPALIAIDLYNLVFKGGNRPPAEIQDEFPNTCGMYAHAAIEPTKRLFAVARAAGIPVIHVTKDARPNARPDKATATKRKPIRTTPEDFEIHPDFRPVDGEIVLFKQRASAFFGTPLQLHLRLLGAESLIICGESTSGCIRASVVDAQANGFHSVVVEECVFDRAPLTHKVNLFDMHHKYADVLSLSEVEAHLRGLESSRAS